MVIQYLKQIGKVKKLDKGVPHELTANQKNRLHNNNGPFLRLQCVKKTGFYICLAFTEAIVTPNLTCSDFVVS